MPVAPTPLLQLGRLIAERRSVEGLSLRALERQSGVSYSWLSKLERGHVYVVPSVPVLAGLCRALGLTLSEVLIASGVELAIVLPGPKRYRELRSTDASTPVL